MPLIAIEFDESQMAQIEELARARDVAPAEWLKTEALKSLPLADRSAEREPDPVPDETTKEARRQARLAILMRSSGIFAGDSDKPKDGLVYQNELRAEWQ